MSATRVEALRAVDVDDRACLTPNHGNSASGGTLATPEVLPPLFYTITTSGLGRINSGIRSIADSKAIARFIVRISREEN